MSQAQLDLFLAAFLRACMVEAGVGDHPLILSMSARCALVSGVCHVFLVVHGANRAKSGSLLRAHGFRKEAGSLRILQRHVVCFFTGIHKQEGERERESETEADSQSEGGREVRTDGRQTEGQTGGGKQGGVQDLRERGGGLEGEEKRDRERQRWREKEREREIAREREPGTFSCQFTSAFTAKQGMASPVEPGSIQVHAIHGRPVYTVTPSENTDTRCCPQERKLMFPKNWGSHFGVRDPSILGPY